MRTNRGRQAASVVRAPNNWLLARAEEEWWKPRVTWRTDAIHEQIAQEFESQPDLLSPAITQEEADEIKRQDRARIESDRAIIEWIRSLPHTPPVSIENMPTLAHEAAWYADGTVEVPSEPALT